MANSFVDYRGSNVRLNDQLLNIILLFLSKSELPSLSESTKRQFDEWAEQASQSPPGLIDVDLSGFWETAEGSAELNFVLCHTEEMIKSYKDFVPGKLLNSWHNSPAVCFVDTATSLILSELKKLQTLVEST